MHIERMYIPSIEQHNAINAAAEPSVNRKKMAEFYRDCIIADAAMRTEFRPEKCDFKAINAAILARWPKGLDYIKTRAWKLIEEMQHGQHLQAEPD